MPVYHVIIHERPKEQNHELYVRAEDPDEAAMTALREVRGTVGDAAGRCVLRVEVDVRNRRCSERAARQPTTGRGVRFGRVPLPDLLRP